MIGGLSDWLRMLFGGRHTAYQKQRGTMTRSFMAGREGLRGGGYAVGVSCK